MDDEEAISGGDSDLSAPDAAPSSTVKAVRDAFVFAVGYWLTAMLWVGFSDQILAALRLPLGTERLVGAIKGQLYVLVTAIILFAVAGRHLRRLYRAEKRAQVRAIDLQDTVDDTVFAMSNVVRYRDPYTDGHEKRVAALAAAIGERLGLSPDQVHALRLIGLMHDIGKVGVPSDILARPGRLDEADFDLVRQHCAIGHDIVAHIDFGFPAAEAVLQHHERLDGSGYPLGLTGKDITLEARILAVADVTEAMLSHRPYRPSKSKDEAIAELVAARGRKLDAAAVDACVELLKSGEFEFSETE